MSASVLLLSVSVVVRVPCCMHSCKRGHEEWIGSARVAVYLNVILGNGVHLGNRYTKRLSVRAVQVATRSATMQGSI